jgi:hypothetical protein
LPRSRTSGNQNRCKQAFLRALGFNPGRLAQLGERLPYKQEDAGSSPAPPTRQPSRLVWTVTEWSRHSGLHRLALEECWRLASARYLHVRFSGLRRDLDRYVDDYKFHRVHNGRLIRGRIPAEIVYGARKVKTR